MLIPNNVDGVVGLTEGPCQIQTVKRQLGNG